MNVRLNLATKPLESQRKFFASAGIVAFLGGVLFLVLGWHVYSELRAQQNLRRKEHDNDRVDEKLTAGRTELDSFFARQENAMLKVRGDIHKCFIYAMWFDRTGWLLT